MSSRALALLELDWPAPKNVKAVISTRDGGESHSPYQSANFATHVGDDITHVWGNRSLLIEQTGVKHWQWLNQVHGTEVITAQSQTADQIFCADGAYTAEKNIACAILTADCLPVILCDVFGTEVASLHAGWRGLAAGIANNAVMKFTARPQNIMAYLGPAIGVQAFEVGEEVLNAFVQQFGREAKRCFYPISDKPEHFFADLSDLARLALSQLGVTQIFGGGFCTYSDKKRFYSYRRDGVTGRMVSAIWIE